MSWDDVGNLLLLQVLEKTPAGVAATFSVADLWELIGGIINCVCQAKHCASQPPRKAVLCSWSLCIRQSGMTAFSWFASADMIELGPGCSPGARHLWQLWLMMLTSPALILSALIIPFSCLVYFRRWLLSKKATTFPFSHKKCDLSNHGLLHIVNIFYTQSVVVWSRTQHFATCFTLGLGRAVLLLWWAPTWLTGDSPTMGTMGSQCLPPKMPLTTF